MSPSALELGALRSVGYFTWNAYSIIKPPDIIVGMLTIGLLGAATTALVHLITRPALAWQRKAR